MGIRVYCPNGHRLNVKDFQAGRKGICPVCGVKMQIPLESTRPSSRDEELQSEGSEPQSAAEVSALTDAIPLPMVAAGSPGQPPASIPAPPAPTVSSTSMPTESVAPPTAKPTVGVGDPLAEAADLVWYVRSPSGEQFGPAAAELMRTWLAEGRVGADAMVWREGWRDWRQADDVFPQLSPHQAIPGLEDIVAKPATTPVLGYAAKRRARQSKQAIAIVALVITVFVLFLVFLWVLYRQ